MLKVSTLVPHLLHDMQLIFLSMVESENAAHYSDCYF